MLRSTYRELEDLKSREGIEAIVAIAQNGEEKASAAMEFLIERYRRLVESKAKAYFIMGAERGDVIQEGYMGLVKAIRDYNPEYGSNFSTFAEMCVKRQLISAVKAARSNNQRPLNNAYSLDRIIKSQTKESADLRYSEALKDKEIRPEGVVLAQEGVLHLVRAMRRGLSLVEFNIAIGYATGKDYKDLAEQQGCDIKKIDNGLQRVRNKFPAILERLGKEYAALP